MTVKILSAKPPVITKESCNTILQRFLLLKSHVVAPFSSTFEDNAHKTEKQIKFRLLVRTPTHPPILNSDCIYRDSSVRWVFRSLHPI
jgi:hypothetical protein